MDNLDLNSDLNLDFADILKDIDLNELVSTTIYNTRIKSEFRIKKIILT